ncbi:MAG: hypothetical protein ACLU99_14690 [Alphaproteobacteria bacterium]
MKDGESLKEIAAVACLHYDRTEQIENEERLWRIQCVHHCPEALRLRWTSCSLSCWNKRLTAKGHQRRQKPENSEFGWWFPSFSQRRRVVPF